MSGTCGAEGKWDLGAVQSPGTSVAPEPLLLAGLESRAELSSPFSHCVPIATKKLLARDTGRVQKKR